MAVRVTSLTRCAGLGMVLGMVLSATSGATDSDSMVINLELAAMEKVGQKTLQSYLLFDTPESGCVCVFPGTGDTVGVEAFASFAPCLSPAREVIVERHEPWDSTPACAIPWHFWSTSGVYNIDGSHQRLRSFQ